MKNTERTVEQIITAVKKAVMPRDATEHLLRGAAHHASAIRIGPGRFALVRDVLSVGGVDPGSTNIFFPTALEAALELDVVTADEADRVYRWQRAERDEGAKKRELTNLEHTASAHGFRLVKITKPKGRRR